MDANSGYNSRCTSSNADGNNCHNGLETENSRVAAQRSGSVKISGVALGLGIQGNFLMYGKL